MREKFYLIIDDAAWLKRFLPLGLKCVQLRVKGRIETEIASQIRTAKHLCTQAKCQLIINDYWKLAREEGCNMIHLGQEDLQQADLIAIRKSQIRIGISTHEEDELEIALKAKADYIALGPIYPTKLKTMRFAPQGIQKISQWKKNIGTIPLVAIGGFSPDRAQGALQAGADSICVVTDVLLNSNPENRLKEWLDITK